MTDSEPLRALFDSLTMTQRFYGVVVGIVTNNEDPENMHRVKVRFPWLSGDVESNWARVAAPMAGSGRGVYFLPEVDDEVLVAFEHGSVSHPYVIGSLWNGQDNPPESNRDGENNHRILRSRSGHVLRFNDSDGSESIELIDKSGNNKIVINTADNTITIEANADIAIKSATGKVTITAQGIELKSRAGVLIEAAQNMDVKANALVNVKGALINLN